MPYLVLAVDEEHLVLKCVLLHYIYRHRKRSNTSQYQGRCENNE